MRRLIALALIASSTGCSNAPIAGFLDCVAPAREQQPPGGDGGAAPFTPDARPPDPRTDVLPPPADSVVPPVGPRREN